MPDGIVNQEITQAETELWDYAAALDEWLVKANEAACTDATIRSFHRAGLTPKLAAFHHAVGLSGAPDADPTDRPVCAWRWEVNGELPTHEPEIEDGEMTEFAGGSNGDGLCANLVPALSPAEACARLIERRKAAVTVTTWRATAVLPTGTVSEEFAGWAAAMNWLRNLLDQAAKDSLRTDGWLTSGMQAAAISAMQGAPLGEPFMFKHGRCEMQITAPAAVTAREEITPQPAPDGQKQAALDEKEIAAGKELDDSPSNMAPSGQHLAAEAPSAPTQPQDGDEIATWIVETRITGRHQDAVTFAKRLGEGEKLTFSVVKSRGGRAPKPGAETVLEELASPEGITSGRAKELLGWTSDPALSHMKKLAERIGRQADVEDLGGVRADKRFRFRPTGAAI